MGKLSLLIHDNVGSCANRDSEIVLSLVAKFYSLCSLTDNLRTQRAQLPHIESSINHLSSVYMDLYAVIEFLQAMRGIGTWLYEYFRGHQAPPQAPPQVTNIGVQVNLYLN